MSGSGRRADSGGAGKGEGSEGFVETENGSGRSGRRRRHRGVSELSGRSVGDGAHKTRGVVVGARVVMGREARERGQMDDYERQDGDAKRRSRSPWLTFVSHDSALRFVRRLDDGGLFRSRPTGERPIAKKYNTPEAGFKPEFGRAPFLRGSAPAEMPRRAPGAAPFSAGPKPVAGTGADVLSISHSFTRRMYLPRLREKLRV